MNHRILWAGLFLIFWAAVFSAGARAEDGVDSGTAATTAQRLDAIEQKENEILRQLADIKAELEIVKVRASLKG